MSRGQIEQVLHEWRAMREVDDDPELAAVRLAIVLEDFLDVTLSDDDIDLAVLSDPEAVAGLAARYGAGT